MGAGPWGKASIMQTEIMLTELRHPEIQQLDKREDVREAAEDFIDRVIVPRRSARRRDPETDSARADLAREERELAKREREDEEAEAA